MKIKEAFVHDLLKQVTEGEISFSRMVELINQEVNQDKWINVKDGLPDVGIPVLISFKSNYTESIVYKVDELLEDETWRFTSGNSNDIHWQPLPEPPKNK